jgi:hypothetical protein
VALRADLSIRAISPNESPGPSLRTSLPSTSTERQQKHSRDDREAAEATLRRAGLLGSR